MEKYCYILLFFQSTIKGRFTLKREIFSRYYISLSIFSTLFHNLPDLLPDDSKLEFQTMQ